MKKFLLSISVIISSVIYIVFAHINGWSNITTSSSVATQQKTQVKTTETKRPKEPTYQATPTNTQVYNVKNTSFGTSPSSHKINTSKPFVHKGQYTNGTYTGKRMDAYYGWVKVQVAIQDGKLATVHFLQYPNDRNTSRYINGQAMPLLKKEAIQAQSALVSGVSGATYTSIAFKQSLSDALIKAKN